jgi:hypothetical protein
MPAADAPADSSAPAREAVAAIAWLAACRTPTARYDASFPSSRGFLRTNFRTTSPMKL